MARLTAHIAGLTAQQMGPALRNPTPPMQQWAHVQNAGDPQSGAHLQMSSYHGCCTHNDASCQAQCPNSPGPSNAAATNTDCCYFCQRRAHPTDRCDRPCPHYYQICVHRATACRNRNLTVPAAAVVSAPALTPALPPPPLKYVTPVTVNPSRTPKMTGHVSVVASYRPMEDSLFITDVMRAVWSTDLAKKYQHLPWALLKELFVVEGLTATNVVLSAPAALRILGSQVARQALQFIANGTIQATAVDKILLNGELSSPAVNPVCRAVEQVSPNAQPPAVVAVLPSTTTTGAQMLAAIAQQQPVAAVTNSRTEVANTFGETLRSINNDISIIEALPFPMATALQSPKIGVLREVYPCRGLVIDFPSKEPISSEDDN
uniref:Uncharacterized protein n=1 Tax=Romanomermis culicivorax TaxID=13658 RepID=A0A915HQ68_ROMCU